MIPENWTYDPEGYDVEYAEREYWASHEYPDWPAPDSEQFSDDVSGLQLVLILMGCVILWCVVVGIARGF